MSSVCWVQFKFTYSFILHSTFHKYKIRQPRSVSKQKLHAFVNIHSHEKNPLALKPSSNGACKERYTEKRTSLGQKQTIRCLEKKQNAAGATRSISSCCYSYSTGNLNQTWVRNCFCFGRFLQIKTKLDQAFPSHVYRKMLPFPSDCFSTLLMLNQGISYYLAPLLPHIFCRRDVFV